MNTNESVTLKCDAKGASKYEWRREGGVIRDDVEGKDTNTLVINKILSSDAGEYYCVASINGHNPIESSKALVVVNNTGKYELY